MKLIIKLYRYKRSKINASLTVEASLVVPLFLFVFISLLYFIQLITVQEILQEAITESGLSMARGAYIYSDFQDVEDAKTADSNIFEEQIQIELEELISALINNIALKHSVGSRLSIDGINKSIIVGGFDGISFEDSKLLGENDDIDIVISYRVRIPIKTFGLQEMNMIQRVKLRGWSGHRLTAQYTMVEENDNEERIVYVTESGAVYHLQRSCSHINISIETIKGKPTWQRNKNGGKYYPCEACCSDKDSASGDYYITTYGDRYHRIKGCSKIKRTVKELALSEVGDKALCKRCANKGVD